MKIKIFALLLCVTSFAFADSVGSFGGGIGSISGNNYGAAAQGDAGGGNSSSGNGVGGTSITINGSGMSAAPGQTQIIGSDADTQQNKNDLLNNYRKDNLSNTYNGLGGSMPNGVMLPSNNSSPSTRIAPDEFQSSVILRTGLLLKNYGYDLFANPNTFAPLDNVPVSSDYVVGPGDEVKIHSWGAIDIDYTATVGKDGSLFIPRVGQVMLVGVRSGELDNYLKSKIGRIYKNFSISTSISKLRSIQITVAGFANKPGSYSVSSLSTITTAVFASGGPSPEGSLRHIELKRNGVVVDDYDMYNLLLKGDSSRDIRLLPGDIIYIKPHGAQVAIYDGVKVPAIYEARENETVANIVVFAGGYTFNNTKQQIIVEKITGRNKIDVFNYAFDAGLKQPVENGEIVHFFRMPNRYNDAIVLIGNVANPSRFNWHKGIRINNIIPNKEVLLTKSFWNSYSKNTYVKDALYDAVDKEKTDNWAGSSDNQSSFSSGLNSTNDTNPSLTNGNGKKGAFGGGDNLFTAGPVAIPEADINWHYAVIVRLDPATYRSILIPFDLEAALNGDEKSNLLLEPGDIINVLSSKDVRNPAKKGVVYVFIDGEVNRPGVYELSPGDHLTDAVNIAGGITSDAYLFGLELDRESVKKRQKASLDQMLDNLQQALLSSATNNTQTAVGSNSTNNTTMILSQQQTFINKLKQLKPTGRIVLDLSGSNKLTLQNIPNILLETGDTIYIPPMPSTVDVVGQVYNPATFAYSAKDTVGDYINRAGTANNFADTSSIYILRADGTLYSKQQAGWFGAFDGQRLNPGDAIIIPQKIQFSTATQNILDWTQILANFGFGIAALNQLK